MSTSFLLLSAAFFVASQAHKNGGNNKKCNQIKIIDSRQLFPIPEGECLYNTVETSKNVVCDESGGAIIQYFDNLECFGEATHTEDPCDGSPSANCSYIAYCDGESCNFASLEWWFGVTQCNEDDVEPDVFTDYIFKSTIFDHDCRYFDNYAFLGNGSYRFKCEGSTWYYKKWLDFDCEGHYDESGVVVESGCNSTDGTAFRLDCNAGSNSVTPGTTEWDSSFDDTDDWPCSTEEGDGKKDRKCKSGKKRKKGGRKSGKTETNYQANAQEEVNDDGAIYDKHESDGVLSTSVVIKVAAAGSVIVVILIAGCAYCVYKKRRKRGHVVVGDIDHEEEDEEDKSVNVEMTEAETEILQNGE